MMEAVVSPLGPQSPGTNGASSTSFASIDPTLIVDYLANVISIALGASRPELEAPGNLLSADSYSDTIQRCSRFATDTQVALYIQKDIKSSGEEVLDGPVDNGQSTVGPLGSDT